MRDSKWEELERTWAGWTIEELEAEYGELAVEMADIKGQIETARAKGGYDKVWMAKAVGASRYRGAEYQRLARYIKRRRVAERGEAHALHQIRHNAQRRYADHFVLAAKRWLAPSVYESIAADARIAEEAAQDALAAALSNERRLTAVDQDGESPNR